MIKKNDRGIALAADVREAMNVAKFLREGSVQGQTRGSGVSEVGVVAC